MTPYVVVILISGIVCAAVSLLELLDRYSYSARFQDVVLNPPGLGYLAVNLTVGATAVPLASTVGLLDLTTAASTGTWALAGKGVLVGLGALGIVRSSFANFGTGDSQLAVGPAEFLDRIKRYLDRKIGLQQKMALDKEIVPKLRNLPERALRYDLPSICLAGVDCPKEEVEKLRSLVDSVFQQRLSPDARRLLIGHALCRLCGVDVLSAAVENMLLEPHSGDDDTPAGAAYLDELAAERARLLSEGVNQ